MKKERLYTVNERGERTYLSGYEEVSHRAEDLADECGHVFDSYGARTPYPFTCTKGIYREIEDNSTIVHHKGNEIEIGFGHFEDIDEDWSLEEYCEVLGKAIECKTDFAAVFLSSGWDSTSILGYLCKTHDRMKIKAFTLELVFDKSGEVVNKYEIAKARAFCEHYGVDLTIVRSSHLREEFIDILKEVSKKELLALTAVSHYELWRAVERSGLEPSKTTVYAGEFSDGAHNFGFAQNFSLVNKEKGFRQYGDKVNSYFLSPAFIERLVRDEDIGNDQIIELFRGDREFRDVRGYTEEKAIRDIAASLFIEDTRGPFKRTDFVTGKDSAENREKLKRLYARNLPKSLEQWYSAILRMYHAFHWSGSTVRGISELNTMGYGICMPFGDKKVLSLLEKMPTRYGRGLEPYPTKFPLKYFCMHALEDYPVKLQEGPHAYLYDIDQSFSLIRKVLINTSLGCEVASSWRDDKYMVRSRFIGEERYARIGSALSSDKMRASDTDYNTAVTCYLVDLMLSK